MSRHKTGKDRSMDLISVESGVREMRGPYHQQGLPASLLLRSPSVFYLFLRCVCYSSSQAVQSYPCRIVSQYGPSSQWEPDWAQKGHLSYIFFYWR